MVFENPLMPDDDDAMHDERHKCFGRFLIMCAQQVHVTDPARPSPRLLRPSPADSHPHAAAAPRRGNMHRFTSGAKNITSASPRPQSDAR